MKDEIVNPLTRKAILDLYAKGMRQMEIAASLQFTTQLVADVLDMKR